MTGSGVPSPAMTDLQDISVQLVEIVGDDCSTPGPGADLRSCNLVGADLSGTLLLNPTCPDGSKSETNLDCGF